MLVSRHVLPHCLPGSCDYAVAAVGWSLRVDRSGFCAKAANHTGSCHTALVAVALVFAWFSAIAGTCPTQQAIMALLKMKAQRYDPAYCGGVYADHPEKKREASTLPIHLSGRVISKPVVISAGQFSEFVPGGDDYDKFTEVPLRQHKRPTAI